MDCVCFLCVFSIKPFPPGVYSSSGKSHPTGNGGGPEVGVPTPTGSTWEGRAIASPKLCLVEFSAFMEQQRDPDTVRTNQFFFHVEIF